MKIDRNPFRDYSAESALFIRRALVAFLGILILSGILVFNLYHLQILRFEDYKTRSNENRIKLVPIAPSRGMIYDRNGTPLAFNRTIYQLEVEETGAEIRIRVCGNGFLYNMVRIIAGTLIEVGSGKRSAEEMPDILASLDRGRAGFTAPPQGLFLWNVEY